MFTRVAGILPYNFKYGLTDIFRRDRLPYRLVNSASIVVHVGAPKDTLRAGRSRAMTLARRNAGGTGRTIVVEPDPGGAKAFEDSARKNGLGNVTVINAAVWDRPAELTLLVDPAHPATNLLQELSDYDQDELGRYSALPVPGNTLSALLEQANVGSVDLLSVTTNGAERSILRGAKQVLRSSSYLALARTEVGFDDILSPIGFRLLGFDDRGMTYVNSK